MPAADGAGGADPARATEYSEQDVMNVLAMIRREFNIDDHRIYLMGHSQGGAGALHLADKYSSIWAAVAGLSPGAPGFQLDANAKFKGVPVLLLVGQKDGFIGSVQRLDERMKSLNIPHEYQEVPGNDQCLRILRPAHQAFLTKRPRLPRAQNPGRIREWLVDGLAKARDGSGGGMSMAIDKAAGKHRRPCETVRIRWL
jgi:pimeloyl-ACP methyl ester carboxylesterase